MTTKQHAKAQESAVTQRSEIEFEDVIKVVFSFSCGPKAQKLIDRVWARIYCGDQIRARSDHPGASYRWKGL